MVRLVTDYLDATVKRFPDKTAFVDNNREITFQSLRGESYAVASSLVRRQLFKQPVAVFLDKSIECIASFLGIAYSGNSIAPLDTKMPLKRIEKIIGILQPQIIITDIRHVEEAKTFSRDAEILVYEYAQDSTVDVDKVEKQLARVIDTDVMYTFFTSGSTGTPKGVVISHRSVLDNVDWITDTFALDETCVIGNEAPAYFALSSPDFFSAIKLGCTLYLMEPSLFIFPAQLMQFLIDKKINTITWVPAVLSNLAHVGILDELQELPPLRHVFFCGGTMPNRHLSIWRNKFPYTKFINLYALTELTAFCTYFVVDRDFADDEPLPIGHPCRNKDIIVLNDKDEPVGNDEVGELCVRGSCLGLGYYNRPERTAVTFVQNPLQAHYPELILRTGDLVRYNGLGELVYVSRKDFQVKHMGQRIELGEIEIVLSGMEGMELNCCLYDKEKAEIVLFYTGSVSSREILQYAKQSLPRYMIPGRVISLESMPMNLSNKVDRVELQKTYI